MDQELWIGTSGDIHPWMGIYRKSGSPRTATFAAVSDWKGGAGLAMESLEEKQFFQFVSIGPVYKH